MYVPKKRFRDGIMYVPKKDSGTEWLNEFGEMGKSYE